MFKTEQKPEPLLNFELKLILNLNLLNLMTTHIEHLSHMFVSEKLSKGL